MADDNVLIGRARQPRPQPRREAGAEDDEGRRAHQHDHHEEGDDHRDQSAGAGLSGVAGVGAVEVGAEDGGLGDAVVALRLGAGVVLDARQTRLKEKGSGEDEKMIAF